MKEYGNTRIMQKQLQNHFTYNDTFSREMNFNVAFGLSEYDDTSNFIEDPDYATVKAFYASWGSAFAESLDTYVELPKHRCRQDEFGYEYYQASVEERESMPKPTFFEPDPNSLDWMKIYSQKMWCTDDKVDIYGHYNSDHAQLFTIVLEKCNPELRATCKNETEITNFFKNKFMYLLINEVHFVTDGFD